MIKTNKWLVSKTNKNGKNEVVMTFSTREEARVWHRKAKNNKKTKNIKFRVGKKY